MTRRWSPGSPGRPVCEQHTGRLFFSRARGPAAMSRSPRGESWASATGRSASWSSTGSLAAFRRH